ncbi:membrane-associated protein, putative [Bodo saltans]|uniref:Membrane-associated protein, putative n=1 Tax=Bodo saltans TaxID=75058 RepID=A0A0S4JMJ3_BODSA|nr:membrane-associated protein, putative [Bodo saltans]|eukprot:CUG91382.1 membrane-associated protein, putative [Bodo saltans]
MPLTYTRVTTARYRTHTETKRPQQRKEIQTTKQSRENDDHHRRFLSCHLSADFDFTPLFFFVILCTVAVFLFFSVAKCFHRRAVSRFREQIDQVFFFFPLYKTTSKWVTPLPQSTQAPPFCFPMRCSTSPARICTDK